MNQTNKDEIPEKSIDISVQIFNIEFKNCLMNASGVSCRQNYELENLNKSKCGAIISKTCSIEKRIGNPEPRYYEDKLGTLNSMGLPNEGYKFYQSKIGKYNKPYMISVAGNYLMENQDILEEINRQMERELSREKDKIMVEINVSCPNIVGKEQIAYNFPDLDKYLKNITNKEYVNLILGLKLPPYFDPVHFQHLYKVLSKYTKQIKFLTAINSVGNTLIVNTETESTVIKPKQGLGGLGGIYIKPVALSNIRQLYNLFGRDMMIIGCGGISSGEDVFQHILCGATLCQIGSQLMIEGCDCFERIENELREILQKKNYKNLNEFRGKLKII